VLLPGEIEARTRRERRANGVLVEDATWNQVLQAIDKFGLRQELGPFL
jgi:LDH2 family malate/lactate/ureidoglycolate dehydrogenase